MCVYIKLLALILLYGNEQDIVSINQLLKLQLAVINKILYAKTG